MGIIDGHDFGSGEMNIFVHTDDPKSAFERVRALIGSDVAWQGVQAGYRDFEEEEYIPIFSPGLKTFSVI